MVEGGIWRCFERIGFSVFFCRVFKIMCMFLRGFMFFFFIFRECLFGMFSGLLFEDYLVVKVVLVSKIFLRVLASWGFWSWWVVSWIWFFTGFFGSFSWLIFWILFFSWVIFLGRILRWVRWRWVWITMSFFIFFTWSCCRVRIFWSGRKVVSSFVLCVLVCCSTSRSWVFFG